MAPDPSPTGAGTTTTQAATTAAAPSPRTPRRTFFRRLLFVVGLVSLAYVLGAAVMFFQLPSSEALRKAFLGARAWLSSKTLPHQPPPVFAPQVDKPDKTYDGFTLLSVVSRYELSTRAYLIDMRGQIVHTWTIRFSEVWSDPPHIKRGLVEDNLVCTFACHLYPNGDLLAVFHGMDKSATGFGLVKLDKDSDVVWKYAARTHHDVDVGEDGTIYAIQHKNIDTRPEGLAPIPAPWLVDYLVMLSPETGQPLREPIPILDAILESPYAPLLTHLEPPRVPAPDAELTLKSQDALRMKQDVTHTNSVHVLSRKLAPKFPGFKAGQVLLSLRTPSALVVLDPDRGKVVWAARGPWKAQHDARFLDTGRILLFDNQGSPRSSRVLEYDPQTQALPWVYPGAGGFPFYSGERGMSQRLPNGNTLIVSSEKGQLLEVTRGGELVWSFSSDGFIPTGRRYGPGELHFLKGGQRARP